jgi:4-phospho-D-threonate 3-dehydrogenase / 4-phospho-D-erythronate 3-dehydrogenase
MDLGTRAAPPEEAAQAVTDSLVAAPSGARIVKKIDSLLRGNLAAELGALAAVCPVVLAPALPGAGRTVRDGVVTLSGEPMHHTDAWRMERRPAPASIAAALDPIRTTVLGLDAVRAGGERLRCAVEVALRQAPLVVCDAETDADLDAIAAAALLRAVAMAGAGGFAAAIGRVLGARPPEGAEAWAGRPTRPCVLVVVGSAEEIAAQQVRGLLDAGAREIRMPLGGPSRVAAPQALGPGVTVLRPDPDAAPGADARAVVAALARTVVALDPGPAVADLVLTGGETARRVLDELDIDRLEPIGQIGHGAVRSRTPDGRHIVTRPGSFGGPGSLCDIVTELRTT